MSGQRTALVLGGGGITGIAWMTGMLAGLADAGVDLTTADVVIGTSAGSVVGAQVTARGAGALSLASLYERQTTPPRAPTSGSAPTPAAMGPGLLARLGVAIVRGGGAQRVRARMGALALGASVMPEQERRDAIAARLPVPHWPDRPLVVTAVDATTGAFRDFDRDAMVGEHPVSLLDAVSASCAVPGVYPPVTIGDRRFVDGGIRSATNADLADGYDRVVVLAPLTWGVGPLTAVATQVERLRERARVVLISPDADAKRAIGRNALDPARRVGSALAGHAQARLALAAVSDVWRG